MDLFFFRLIFFPVMTTLSAFAGSSREFQAAFCNVFLWETFDLKDFGSDLFRFGEEEAALEPATELGLELLLALVLLATLDFSILSSKYRTFQK